MSFDINYVEKLAHLELPALEKSALEGQLRGILAYVDKLSALDTTGVEPMLGTFSAGTPMREDIVIQATDTEQILANAPAQEAHGFRVPKILQS